MMFKYSTQLCLQSYIFISAYQFNILFIHIITILLSHLNTQFNIIFPSIIYTYIHNTYMQLLELRLKFLTEWIINKKQQITDLVTNHLPIFKSIRNFIQQYINYMQSIIDIIHKAKDELISNGNVDVGRDKILFQLYELVGRKETIGIQQWTEKLAVLEERFQVGAKGKPFPDIFKDIDTNVEYYNGLRQQIAKVRERDRGEQKQSYRNNNHRTSSNVFKKYNEYGQNIENIQRLDYNSTRSEIQKHIYDPDYLTKLQKLRSRAKIFDFPHRQYEQSRISPAIKKPQQLSPYRLVNPKYSPHKINPESTSRAITQPFESPYITLNKHEKSNAVRNQKYKQYKAQLMQQMKQQTSRSQHMKDPLRQKVKHNITQLRQLRDEVPTYHIKNNKVKDKYQANALQKYFIDQDSIVRKIDFDRSYEQEKYLDHQHTYWSDSKNKMQKRSPNNLEEIYHDKNNLQKRKYQYLFEEDRDITTYAKPRSKNKYEPFHPKTPPKKQPRLRPLQPLSANPKIKPQFNQNEDSLQQDRLGYQLQVEMPVLFKDKEDNLEQLLANSLISSKRWDSPPLSEDSQNDSLEEHQIRQTGKFKQPVYTDEDDTYENTPEKQVYEQYNQNGIDKLKYEKPLTIEKQISSESKDLNMSFGKN